MEWQSMLSIYACSVHLSIERMNIKIVAEQRTNKWCANKVSRKKKNEKKTSKQFRYGTAHTIVCGYVSP